MIKLAKVNIDELCEMAERLVKAFSDKPGRGLLLFVTVEREDYLRKLAIKLAKKLSKDGPLPIYVIQGHIRGEHGWPFSRIRKGARIKLETDGTMFTETGGLIFPQDCPIVLLAEYFDYLEPQDQQAYAHLVDGEGGEFALHTGSVLIAGIVSTNRGKIEPSIANRGLHCELTMETQ